MTDPTRPLTRRDVENGIYPRDCVLALLDERDALLLRAEAAERGDAALAQDARNASSPYDVAQMTWDRLFPLIDTLPADGVLVDRAVLEGLTRAAFRTLERGSFGDRRALLAALAALDGALR